MDIPLVSAIVLNYRTPQDAVKCAHALLEQTIGDRLEVIVVDSHSCDDSIGVLRNRLVSVDGVRIIEARVNGGYGKGNNFGVHSALGEYVLVINPDNELESSGLERMVEMMRGDRSIGVLAPRLVHPDGTVRDSARAFPSLFDGLIKRTFLHRLFPKAMRRYLQQDRRTEGAREVDWVAGACFLMRRDFFEELRGFDERFFLFMEDTDLCRRVKESGKRVVYFPDVVAQDSVKRLSEGGLFSLIFSRTGRAHLQSAVRYFWKWGW